MSAHIINITDIDLQPRPASMTPSGAAAEKYAARMGFVAPRIGAQKLGYNITEVPPGKRAFPFHNHRVNEEMFFILEGSGEVRLGDNTHAIRAGDFISCPPGGREAAHQIINTSDAPLRYLAVSTKLSPELAEYPDSGKFGVLAELSSTPGEAPQVFRFVGRPDNAVDYWDGE